MRQLIFVSLLTVSACGSPAGLDAARASRALGILQVNAGYGQVPVVDGTYGGQVRWYPPLESREAVLLPPSLLSAPDTVALGQPVTISVGTIGLDGCWSPDGGDVTQDSTAVDITPYDVRSGAALCTVMSLERSLLHHFTVTLVRPGTHTIRIHGRRAISADGLVDDLVTAERSVVAR
jgi:hypothetical protein